MKTTITKRILVALACGTAVFTIAAVLPGTAYADGPATALTGPQAAELAVRKMEIVIGKSRLVDSPINIQRISIAMPDVIEALAVSPKQLLINGKKEGETSLIIWEQGGERVLFDVRILPNPSKMEAVQRQIRDELAGQDITLEFDNNTPLLRGTAKDLGSAERAVTIATILGKPVNMLRVATPPPHAQILLKVRFMDVDRQLETEFGANFFRNQGASFSGALSTSQYSPNALTVPTGSEAGNNASSALITNALNLLLYNKSINVGAYINLLQNNNIAEILAEPNLLAIDGKPASFVSGGEFPFPTVGAGTGGASQISISFRRFGVSIDFVPHITSRGTIRLEVTPEVSSLDFANGLIFQGYTIPALATRRVQTEIELESGQSFAIGGLLDNRTTETLAKVPGLSAIPFFGKLFQSRSTKKNKSELLVVVTPEIVRPVPEGQEPPALTFPLPFIKEGGSVPPRTPGLDKTGPVPVTSPTPTIPVESLIEERNRDKDRPTPSPQLQLLGIPVNPAPAGGGLTPSPDGTPAPSASNTQAAAAPPPSGGK